MAGGGGGNRGRAALEVEPEVNSGQAKREDSKGHASFSSRVLHRRTQKYTGRSKVGDPTPRRMRRLHGLKLCRRDGWVSFGEQLLTVSFVIENAFVLIRVSVLRAEVILTLALEAKKSNLLVAAPAAASVNLLLLRRLVVGLITRRRCRLN